jgi:hypothetical protein
MASPRAIRNARPEIAPNDGVNRIRTAGGQSASKQSILHVPAYYAAASENP